MTAYKTKQALIPKLRFREFEGKWNESVLKKICEIKGRIGYRGYTVQDIVEKGKGAITLSPSNINDGNLNFNNSTYISWDKYEESPEIKLEVNDILLVKTGSTVGKSAFVKTISESATINPQLVILKRSSLVPHFLGYLLYHPIVQKQISATVGAGAVPNLSQENISNFIVPYPTLPEQQKIASFLSAVDEKIQLLSRKKELLENYKKGSMQQLFSQKLRFKDAAGKDFPEWEEKRLGDLCSVVTGKLDANAMKEDGRYRFYTCAREFYRIDEYAFDTEALLVSGNGANVGYIHYYKGKFNAYQRTYVLDGFVEDIIYVKKFLEHNLHKRIYTEKKEGNTPYITLNTLTDLIIGIPCLSEQQKIASFLSAIDEKIEAVNQQITKSQTLKKGLLQQMFV